jgi:hypothetical protein
MAIRHITRASLLTGMWRGQDNSNGQSSSKADCNQPSLDCQKKKKRGKAEMFRICKKTILTLPVSVVCTL